MSESMVFCRGCGKEIHESAPTCPQCGALQRIDTPQGKSKVVAGVLAIFLGGIGIHRFYLGQWWGIFYLLLFWTWIPAIIAFIEGIVFLCTSDENWNRAHGHKKNIGAGGVVALVIGVIVGIMLVGILAAIAIPAYQDYTERTKQYSQNQY